MVSIHMTGTIGARARGCHRGQTPWAIPFSSLTSCGLTVNRGAADAAASWQSDWNLSTSDACEAQKSELPIFPGETLTDWGRFLRPSQGKFALDTGLLSEEN